MTKRRAWSRLLSHLFAKITLDRLVLVGVVLVLLYLISAPLLMSVFTAFHTLTRVTVPVLRPARLSVLVSTAIITLESFDIPLRPGMGAGARVLATSVYFPLFPQIGLPRSGAMAAIALTFLAST